MGHRIARVPIAGINLLLTIFSYLRMTRNRRAHCAGSMDCPGRFMRILFYLPVITPWWFGAIVTPLIALLARQHDVHVLAPVPWRNTGVGERERQMCAHLPVTWHIVHDDSHPSMRTDPVQQAGIVDFVNALAPDYVLCRSADCETVAAFPGVVRHIMEGGADPLRLPSDWIVFKERPFDHGILPELGEDETAELDRLSGPLWDALSQSAASDDDAMRERFRQWADLPKDRPTLLLPLEYEHEENFFLMHRVGAKSNAALVREVAETVGDDVFLAITNHPLNELHVDNSAMEDAVASLGPKARLFPSLDTGGPGITDLLVRNTDGVLVFDSKIFSLAGHHGAAMLRRSRFATGDWLNPYTEFGEFLTAIAQKRARRPDRDTGRTWLAHHIANDVIDPRDPELTAAGVLDRMENSVDPKRWERGFAHYYETAQGVAA